MDNLNKLSVVIQAGGKSSRMGENKSVKSFIGIPLIQRIYERLLPIADEIIVVTNEPSLYSFLRAKIVMDSIVDQGALGGLFTAMDVSEHELVAVVASDLPFVSVPIINKCKELLISTGSDVSIPKTSDDYYEPLHAVYRKSTCKDAIFQAIIENKRRLISWFPYVKVQELDEVACRKLDPSGLAFFNINTKEDFSRAESLAKN